MGAKVSNADSRVSPANIVPLPKICKNRKRVIKEEEEEEEVFIRKGKTSTFFTATPNS